MLEAHYNIIMPLVAQEAHTLSLRLAGIEEWINVINGSQFKEALALRLPAIIEERDKLKTHISLLNATMRHIDNEVKYALC